MGSLAAGTSAEPPGAACGAPQLWQRICGCRGGAPALCEGPRCSAWFSVAVLPCGINRIARARGALQHHLRAHSRRRGPGFCCAGCSGGGSAAHPPQGTESRGFLPPSVTAVRVAAEISLSWVSCAQEHSSVTALARWGARGVGMEGDRAQMR